MSKEEQMDVPSLWRRISIRKNRFSLSLVNNTCASKRRKELSGVRPTSTPSKMRTKVSPMKARKKLSRWINVQE